MSETPSRPSKCPICGKQAEDKYRPFCSARCASVDLNRWLGEVYVLPGDEPRPAAGSDPDRQADDE